MKLQSAVKKETVAVAAGTGIGCAVLIVLFLIMYLIFPESSVEPSSISNNSQSLQV